MEFLQSLGAWVRGCRVVALEASSRDDARRTASRQGVREQGFRETGRSHVAFIVPRCASEHHDVQLTPSKSPLSNMGRLGL